MTKSYAGDAPTSNVRSSLLGRSSVHPISVPPQVQLRIVRMRSGQATFQGLQA